VEKAALVILMICGILAAGAGCLEEAEPAGGFGFPLAGGPFPNETCPGGTSPIPVPAADPPLLRSPAAPCNSSPDQGMEWGERPLEIGYVYRGDEYRILFPTYDGVAGYLEKLEPVPSDYDRYLLQFIDEPVQDLYLDYLADLIREECREGNPDECVRIATGIVQNLPYDHAKAAEIAQAGRARLRYPYETLRRGGICSDKSFLLAYLYRELGYGTAIFSFGNERHMAVGIRCPAPYDFRSSGYCIVETTAPSIITDEHLIFNQVYPLQVRYFSIPHVTVVSGDESVKSFDSVFEEFQDARWWMEATGRPVVNATDRSRVEYLMHKYGMDRYAARYFSNSSPPREEEDPSGSGLSSGWEG